MNNNFRNDIKDENCKVTRPDCINDLQSNENYQMKDGVKYNIDTVLQSAKNMLDACQKRWDVETRTLSDDEWRMHMDLVKLQRDVNSFKDKIFTDEDENNKFVKVIEFFKDNGMFHINKCVYEAIKKVSPEIIDSIKNLSVRLRLLNEKERERFLVTGDETCFMINSSDKRDTDIGDQVEKVRKTSERMALDLLNEFNGILDKTVMIEILAERLQHNLDNQKFAYRSAFNYIYDDAYNASKNAINSICEKWALEFHNVVMTHAAYERMVKMFAKIYSAKMAAAFGVKMDIGLNKIPVQWNAI